MPRDTAFNRVVLLPATAAGGPAAAPASATPIRRYRLATIRQDARDAADRFAHLRRAHD